MKRKLSLALVALFVFSIGIGTGVYIRNQTLNPRAVIPNFFERILGSLVQKEEEENEDLLYHNASLSDFIVNGSKKTKISVEGIVVNVVQEPDGDHHAILRPDAIPFGLTLVTEVIPEIPLPLPQKGDRIKMWGITRFDILHNWWELHPVIGWQKL